MDTCISDAYGVTEAMDVNLGKLRETVRHMEAMGSQRVGHEWATEEQQHGL